MTYLICRGDLVVMTEKYEWHHPPLHIGEVVRVVNCFVRERQVHLEIIDKSNEWHCITANRAMSLEECQDVNFLASERLKTAILLANFNMSDSLREPRYGSKPD